MSRPLNRCEVAAAETDPRSRLPELYCGFARGEEAGCGAPVAYPVSCSPQAWAAAAGQLLVRAMLGLGVDVERGVLLVAPALPAWLSEVTIRGLHVRSRWASLTVRREEDGYAVEAEGPVEVVGGETRRGG